MTGKNARYPNREDATLSPTPGYDFIIALRYHREQGKTITKAHSAYMSYRGRKHGWLIDYRTREWATRALSRAPDGVREDFAVEEIQFPHPDNQ